MKTASFRAPVLSDVVSNPSIQVIKLYDFVKFNTNEPRIFGKGFRQLMGYVQSIDVSTGTLQIAYAGNIKMEKVLAVVPRFGKPLPSGMACLPLDCM